MKTHFFFGIWDRLLDMLDTRRVINHTGETRYTVNFAYMYVESVGTEEIAST